jgi:hypothetical protein
VIVDKVILLSRKQLFRRQRLDRESAYPFKVDANNEEIGKYLLPEPFQNIFSSLIPQSHSRETKYVGVENCNAGQGSRQ